MIKTCHLKDLTNNPFNLPYNSKKKLGRNYKQINSTFRFPLYKTKPILYLNRYILFLEFIDTECIYIKINRKVDCQTSTSKVHP